MATQHESLDRQHQSLDSQQHGVHQSDRVDGVQSEALRGAELAGRNQFVIAGIGVDDAAATGGNSLKATFIKRLKERKDRPWFCSVLQIDKLVSAAKLTGRDIVLDV